MSGEDTDRRDGRDLDAVDAYDYELPDELIAAHPADRRVDSRLLVARRQDRRIDHRRFSQIGAYLREGDLLVFNDTQVVPARILGRKPTGGAIELLVLDVLEPAGPARWEEAAGDRLALRCMTRSSNPPRPGMEISVDRVDAPPLVIESWEAGRATVRVDWAGSAIDLLDEIGQMPLPPYILKRREAIGEASEATDDDRRRYQTVYADKPGAVAAPTAGLHFSDELLDELRAEGVERAFVTLQVGAGTFRPISTDRLSEHDMHGEEYEISAELADAIARCRRRGGRVVAVGTTSVRALESEARRDEPFEPGLKDTDLFLHPGKDFEVVDALITNFHLPRSTLLALVAGFAGYDFMRRMYAEAVEREYRFYSYGDAMFIV